MAPLEFLTPFISHASYPIFFVLFFVFPPFFILKSVIVLVTRTSSTGRRSHRPSTIHFFLALLLSHLLTMSANNNPRSPCKRDDISIAFTQSHYPTPYTDHAIPGSTPGHRLLRLGRQYQPEDILYNHLSHALIAHGDGSNSTATPWEGNADHPNPPGGNYILHTKNGGKRHYDEPSGRFSEQPWQPSKRMIAPLQEEERCVVPQRRGRGVYNTDDGYIHPDAEEARRQREWAEQRRREHGGKARVDGPPDHTLTELGLVQQQSMPPVTASTGIRASSSFHVAAAAADATSDTGLPKEKQDATTSSKNARAAVVDEDAGRNKAYNGRALLPSVGAGVPPARGTAVEADAVAVHHRDQRMRCALHERNKAAAATATRAADAQSVRELPNW